MRNVNQTGKTNNDLITKLVTFITETKYSQLPVEVVEISKRAILDTLAVALAGWSESAVAIAKKVYAPENGEQGSQSTLWGDSTRVGCSHAAIINGTAAHVLDYDDASVGVVIHPSAPILSAIIPLAEKLHSTGKDVITAYAIGTEVMTRVGQVMGINHYRLGWHATDTLGTIGAAAACASMQRLDTEKCRHAIAIAASMAGGLQKNFGSMTKSFHVGLSASHGVQSVELASHGFTGNGDVFGSRGFFTAFSGGQPEEELQQAMNAIKFAEPYDMLTGISVKKFPCCFATHRFIQGAIDLREAHQLSLDSIEEIVLHAQSKSLLPLIHSSPQTGLQAKFSAEYTVLSALHDGYVRLSSFTDQQVQRAIIQQLLPAVKVLPLQESEEDRRLNRRLPVEIEIRTKDQQIFKKTVAHAPGSKENPLTEKEHREKWNSCLEQYAPLPLNNEEKEEVFNVLYDQGNRIEQYLRFGDWIKELHKQLYVHKLVNESNQKVCHGGEKDENCIVQ